jgi:hypothetical protein
MLRVWIAYEPRVYADVFARVLEGLGPAEIVGDPSAGVDVIMLPLCDEDGRPHVNLLPDPVPDAKLVAFSPTGTHGLVRLPGRSEWEEIRPFGLGRMLAEVLAGRDRPPAGLSGSRHRGQRVVSVWRPVDRLLRYWSLATAIPGAWGAGFSLRKPKT